MSTAQFRRKGLAAGSVPAPSFWLRRTIPQPHASLGTLALGALAAGQSSLDTPESQSHGPNTPAMADLAVPSVGWSGHDIAAHFDLAVFANFHPVRWLRALLAGGAHSVFLASFGFAASLLFACMLVIYCGTLAQTHKWRVIEGAGRSAEARGQMYEDVRKSLAEQLYSRRVSTQ